MPQERYELSEEEREELGIPRAVRTPPRATPEAEVSSGGKKYFDLDVFLGRKKEPGMMSGREVLQGIVLPTAAGAATGGPIGAAAGLFGGALSPESGPEQAAATAASNLLGPAGRIPQGVRTLSRMLGAGTAAGAVRGLRTGDAGEAALTGGLAGLGEGVGQVAGLVGAPGVLRRGMLTATDEIKQKFGDLFGARIRALRTTAPSGQMSVESVVERIAAKPNVPTTLQKMFEKPGNLSSLTTRIFSNPKTTQSFMQAANTNEKAALFGRFMEDQILRPNLIRSKAGLMSRGEGEIFNAKHAYADIKSFIEGDVFPALHQDLKKSTLVLRDMLRVLDPSEGLAAQSEIGQGLLKVGVFSSMRQAAGMRGALSGATAGVGANLVRKVWNPEVRSLIERASRGELEAARGLVRTIGIWASEPPS